MTRIYTENDLVLPALHFMEQNGGTITTANLIPRMESYLKPTGIDAEKLENRNDTHLSQKVRNLKCHDKLTNLGFATYDYESGLWSITDKGRKYLDDNRDTL